MSTDAPLVLVDQPDDGWCEATGWVEATATEEEARELLAPCTMDDKDRIGLKPAGKARRVWLAVTEPPEHIEEERWVPVDPDHPGAREFFEFDATDLEPPKGGNQ